MKSFRKLIAVSAILAFMPIANAPAADDSLYRDLGGEKGIARIVEIATKHYLTDPRVKTTFEDTNIERFKHMFAEQFCALTGGPCKYTGHTMAEAHKGLHLKDADFTFVVEGLQDALDEVGIPFRVQNRFLALLAPMKRDVVTR
jgi:hemoglobin